MDFSNDPVWKSFRSTGKLITEWKDTLFYGAIGLALPVLLQENKKYIVTSFMFAAFIREGIRGLSWEKYKPAFAGINQSRDLKDEYKASAYFSANLLGAALPASLAIIWGDPFILIGTGAFLTANFECQTMLREARVKVKDLPRIYFDKKIGMWDWNRKNPDDGDGTSQTQRIKDGFKAFAQHALGILSGGKTRPLQAARTIISLNL